MEKRKNIIFLGYIKTEDLVCLLNGCEAMVLPSLWEGFGLPLVEAVACGTAVIASNTSCIPEIAKDAALLVNPLDYKDIGDSIVKVIENTELKQKLIKKGLERAKDFSWEENARKTYETYKEVVERYGNYQKWKD